MVGYLGWIYILDFRYAIRLSGANEKKDSSLDILQKRFASRQINKDEYQEQKKILANDLAKRRIAK